MGDATRIARVAGALEETGVSDEVDKLIQQARDYSDAASIIGPVADSMTRAIRVVIGMLERGETAEAVRVLRQFERALRF